MAVLSAQEDVVNAALDNAQRLLAASSEEQLVLSHGLGGRFMVSSACLVCCVFPVLQFSCWGQDLRSETGFPVAMLAVAGPSEASPNVVMLFSAKTLAPSLPGHIKSTG